MDNELLLLSGNDIPFYAAKLNIRQPKLKDIALIGESSFFTACHLLNFSKDLLSEEDKINLSDISDFDILMSIINEKQAASARISVLMLLTLLFPNYSIDFSLERGIVLTENENEYVLNRENYSEFKEILVKMFKLSKMKGDDYNPVNSRAAEIAEKLRKGREKAAEAKGEKTGSIFSRYVSILSIGLKINVSDLLEYTIYQIHDTFDRFNAYQNFDINLRARMAGATDLDEVPNWMGDID